MQIQYLAAMALTVCVSALASGMAVAQSYPAKPVTIVIGSSPGSTTDGLARAMGAQITRETGQPVIVDSRPGAFGGIAAQLVARSAPDGYTLFMTTNTTQAANPHLVKNLPYNPIKDFAPIGQVVQGYMVMVVNPNVKATNVPEFIALAKKEPGKLTFGSGSSSARVATEQFQHMTGTKLTYVPYKANPAAVIDLVAGQTDVMIVDLTTSLPQVKAGKLRALGVSSPQRSPLLPNVPTIAEQGVKGYESGYWNGLYAPAGTPVPIINRLNALMRNAMATESIRHFVTENGMEVKVSSPEDLAKFQLAELARWGAIIKTAGIQPE